MAQSRLPDHNNAAPNSATHDDASDLMVITSGGALGVLIGVFVGLSTSPIVSSVASAVVAIVAALAAVRAQPKSEGEGSEKKAHARSAESEPALPSKRQPRQPHLFIAAFCPRGTGAALRPSMSNPQSALAPRPGGGRRGVEGKRLSDAQAQQAAVNLLGANVDLQARPDPGRLVQSWIDAGAAPPQAIAVVSETWHCPPKGEGSAKRRSPQS